MLYCRLVITLKAENQIKDRWRDPKIMHPAQKPVITPHSALEIAILTVADTIFLTKMQKRENQLNRSSP